MTKIREEIIKVIEKEIDWCRKQKSYVGQYPSKESRRWFIVGLKQAKYLVENIEEKQ